VKYIVTHYKTAEIRRLKQSVMCFKTGLSCSRPTWTAGLLYQLTAYVVHGAVVAKALPYALRRIELDR